MRTYHIDFTTKTITITKAFAQEAQNPNSNEYAALIRFRSDFPDFRIIEQKSKAKRKSSRVTYDKMVKYISCQKDSTVLLKRFAEIRELSKGEPSPYNFVYKWFNETFPTYGHMPQFDKDGNIVPQYNLNSCITAISEAGSQNVA